MFWRQRQCTGQRIRQRPGQRDRQVKQPQGTQGTILCAAVAFVLSSMEKGLP